MILEGQCHCGAVKITAPELPKVATECNCSICHRYGVIWAYYTDKEANITAAPDVLQSYSWGDNTIDFQRCRRCGCVTHYSGTSKSGSDRVAINLRMIDPATIKDIRIRKFDGADSWTYLDEPDS
jgi:hypothetical protein